MTEFRDPVSTVQALTEEDVKAVFYDELKETFGRVNIDWGLGCGFVANTGLGRQYRGVNGNQHFSVYSRDFPSAATALSNTYDCTARLAKGADGLKAGPNHSDRPIITFVDSTDNEAGHFVVTPE